MSDEKIICMYFNHRFNEKPQGKQCGWVQKSIIPTEITINELAEALCHGATFKPAEWKVENHIIIKIWGNRIFSSTNKVIIVLPGHRRAYVWCGEAGKQTLVGEVPVSFNSCNDYNNTRR